MSEQITLRKRVAELVSQHGSLRAAARALNVDCSYLHRIGSGEKTQPADLVLRRMGLRRVTVYERIEKKGATNEQA